MILLTFFFCVLCICILVGIDLLDYRASAGFWKTLCLPVEWPHLGKAMQLSFYLKECQIFHTVTL